MRVRSSFGHDLDHETCSLGQRLRELLQGGHTVVLFVPDALVHPLGEAVAQAAPGVDLRVERSRVVGGASFHLRAEVFSREIAGELRAIVRNLPPGVHTSHVSEHEEAHADAKGIEFHAPAHEYVYRLEADVAGTLPGVLDVRTRVEAFEQVDLGPLVLS